MNKRDAEKFMYRAAELLTRYGAQPSTEGVGVFGVPYDYETDTPLGKLHLTPAAGSRTFTVFCRFAEPDRARKRFDCNPHSGKYNFHCECPDACLESTERFLDALAAVL